VNSTLDRWPYDVACTSTGKAIFSITQIYTGGGIPQLCQVDLGSLIGSSRSDTPNLPEPAMLRATADRTRVFVTADYLTTKTVLKFDALADNFPTSGIGPGAFSTIDVKSDGSRVLVCPGPRVFDGTLSTLGDIAAGGTFAAFRQGTSTAYSHAGATQISILNVTGLSVSGSFTLPVAAAGRMRCDPAGTRLFVATQNGVAIVSLP
jgi:hypothetical protein